MLFNKLFKKIFYGLLLFFSTQPMFSADLLVNANGIAQINGKYYRCAIGKCGVTPFKVEGDLKTPVGKFPLRYLYYRPDKFPQGVCSGLPQKPLKPNLGWCDDVTSTAYNTLVRLPFSGHYEVLWRKDEVYDLIVVIGYNDQPVRKNKGSAIFIHIASPNYEPTYGCIVFSRQDLLAILKALNDQSFIFVLN